MTRRPRALRPSLASSVPLLLALAAPGLSAQVDRGGTPPSVRLGLEPPCPTHALPEVDVAALLAEDELRGKDEPFRFAELLPVELGLDDAGAWTDLGNGDRVWRLRLESTGAWSLMLVFSRFQLPRGSELFVYDDERSVLRGAYTHESNAPDGSFAVRPTPGEALTLEYFEPGGAEFPGELRLSAVLHDYRDLLGESLHLKGGGLGSSGACNVNVACPEGVGWEEQTDATVLVLTAGGACCSGVLVNNTGDDATPYVLTAEHCGDLQNSVFQLNWYRPNCGGGKPLAQNDTQRGSELVVSDAALDFQLVRLTAQIPSSYEPYFAGWDRRGVVPASTTVLHHPRGDAMKISIDDHAPLASGPTWRIKRWETGTTEGGSSGSPLYSPNRMLIGVLKGGAATCSTPIDDYFVRLDAMWPLLAPHLDPTGSGVDQLPGLDPALDPPPPFAVTAVAPGQVPPLIPGTEETVRVNGSGITHATTLDLDGAPLAASRFSYWSNSRLTLDLPQLALGRHTLTVHEGGQSFDVPIDVLEASGPIHQAGNGDPGNVVTRFSGVDLSFADHVGHVNTCYWSPSNAPSVHPLATLDIGNQFTQLGRCAMVTIPAQGWLTINASIPNSLVGSTVYSQTICFSCFLANPGQPIPVSNSQEAHVLF